MASEYISHFSACTHMCTSKTVLFTKNLLHFKISLQTKRRLHLYLLNCFYPQLELSFQPKTCDAACECSWKHRLVELYWNRQNLTIV